MNHQSHALDLHPLRQLLGAPACSLCHVAGLSPVRTGFNRHTGLADYVGLLGVIPLTVSGFGTWGGNLHKKRAYSVILVVYQSWGA